MTRIIARKLAPLPVTLWVVTTIVFLVLRVLPGSAVDTIVSQGVSSDQRAKIIASLHLNDSILQQYVAYLGQVIHLNTGVSFYSGASVGSLVKDAMPVTIELTVASTIIMVLVGVTLGIVAANSQGRKLDAGSRFIATVFFSMPWFWFGILLIIVFGVWMGVLPTFGRLPPSVDYRPTTNFILIDAVIQGRFDLIGPWLEYLILPALTIGLTTAGFVMRISRGSFIETAREDFVRTARMKGRDERGIFRHHILRNASLPIVTIVGLQFGALLGGAVITEVVFSYPGVGQMMVNAIIKRDYPVVQGGALTIAFLYILVNTLTDISYLYLDPRLRRQ
jgi:peptide/nickel transport system permease protein